VGQVERELIQQVLQSCDRIQIKAASRLGINRNTLHKKLSEYRLDEGDSETTAKIPTHGGGTHRNGNSTDPDNDEDSQNPAQPGEPVIPAEED
jgi:transposase-like protein